MKIGIGILTTLKRGKAQSVTRLWLNRLPDSCRYNFLLGSDSMKEDKEFLHLPVEEAYENLPLKTHFFCRYYCENFDFDYLFKCDDTTWVNADKFVSAPIGDYCGCPVKTFNWLHHYGKCKDMKSNRTLPSKYKGHYCNGGCGYFLSHKAALIVGDKKNEQYFEQELYEDKAVGDLLRDNKIYPVWLTGMKDVGSCNGSEIVSYNVEIPNQIESLENDYKSAPKFENFIISGMARSGTTLLQHSLNAHPKITCWGELLNENTDTRMRAYKEMPAKLGEEPILRNGKGSNYLSRFFNAEKKQNDLIGAKVLESHAERSDGWTIIKSENVRVLFCVRHPLASFISKEQSMEDQVWNGPSKPKKMKIEFNLNKWEQYEIRWYKMCDRMPKNSFKVYYHDLVFNYKPTISQVFRFLDMPGIDLPKPKLTKQRQWNVLDRVTNPDVVSNILIASKPHPLPLI